MKKLMLLVVSFFFINVALSHGMSEADKLKALQASNWEYVELGAIHMLTGYDHLLFLLGVMFFLFSFKDILKFITAFTIGHSITLILATLFEIKANYYLVDAVIALTVMYKAFDNLDGFKRFLNVKSPNLLLLVFIFGLIHGFGLSTRLQQLPLADHGLIAKILSFNIGVEVGQVLALIVMVAVLTMLRKLPFFDKFSKAANVLLMFIGFLLLLMQLHGYLHTQHPDEFPLNKDDHSHIHEDISQNAQVVEFPILPKQESLVDEIEVKEAELPIVEEPKPIKDTHHHGDGVHHHH